jgi:hypothetical protein
MGRPEDYTPPHELDALLREHQVPTAVYKGGLMNETTRQRMLVEIACFLEKLKREELIKPNDYPFTLEADTYLRTYTLTWKIPVQVLTFHVSPRVSDKPSGAQMPYIPAYIRRILGKETP